MRLLHRASNGNLRLTEDLNSGTLPQYAILSHTWGTEEVTFKDMVDGTGKHKSGYAKISFCAEQARKDGLDFFWVDTCCIDKSTSDELQASLNSMFRWYGEGREHAMQRLRDEIGDSTPRRQGKSKQRMVVLSIFVYQ